jgi:UDP:flavonoid glycosyltransferase YjiC (YdhE family)
MRVLFTTLAARPHLYPLVPLAWALRAAGHDVRIAGQPAILDDIVAAGLFAVEVGADVDFLAGIKKLYGSDEEMNDWVRRAIPHVAAADAMARDLIAFTDGWHPDLIVTDPAVFAAPILAERKGIPLVRHLWGPTVVGRPGQAAPGTTDVRATWPPLLVTLYDRWEVPVRGDYARRVVDPCPPSMQSGVIANRLPMRYVAYNGAADVPPWLTEPPARQRVCVTWGTTVTDFTGGAGFRVPEILDAVAKLDVEVVVAVSAAERELLGDVAVGVRVVTGMPLSLLLPTCAGVVSQGGAGTVLTAAACGVPQVVIPQVPDQPLNAGRVAATGAGIALDAEHADSPSIFTAVEQAIGDPGLRRSADRLRAEIEEQPSPADVVDALENLV